MEALKSREGEVLTLLGFLLPALAGFGTLAYYFEREDGISEKMFVLGWMAMQALLALGAKYILAMAYNFRYNLLQMHKIEYEVQVQQVVLDGWRCPAPKCTTECADKASSRKKEWVPEIFRPQHDFLWVLVLVSGIVPLLTFSRGPWRLATSTTVAAATILGLLLLTYLTPLYAAVSWISERPRWYRVTCNSALLAGLTVGLFDCTWYLPSWLPLVVGGSFFLWLWWGAHDCARRLNSIIKTESGFATMCTGKPTEKGADEPRTSPCDPFRRLPMSPKRGGRA